MDAGFFAEYINHGVRFAVESTGVPQLTAPQVARCALPVPPCARTTRRRHRPFRQGRRDRGAGAAAGQDHGYPTGHDAATPHRKDSVAMKQRSGTAEPQLGATAEEAKLGLGAPRDRDAPVGWYSRGYLPHFDSFGVMQSITFRVADSLPQQKLRQLEQELAARPETERDSARRRAIDAWLAASGYPQPVTQGGAHAGA